MRPIHLAVPSYNNAAGLRNILQQAVQQPFASIRVLDDGSVDDTAGAVKQFPTVIHVRADKNGGPVAAKNLVLKNPPPDGWILFVDSDMELVTPNIPECLNTFLDAHPKCGAGGGRIIAPAGHTHLYNRGYDLHPIRLCIASLLRAVHKFSSYTVLQRLVERISIIFMYSWAKDVSHRADWVVEGFFFVRTDLFVGTGGYEKRMYRFHEGPDFCLRLRKLGYQVWFTPDIEIQDRDQHTGTSTSRAKNWWRSLWIYYKKHPERLFLYRWPRP